MSRTVNYLAQMHNARQHMLALEVRMQALGYVKTGPDSWSAPAGTTQQDFAKLFNQAESDS